MPPMPMTDPQVTGSPMACSSMFCRACGLPLTTVFADLGRLPISNAFQPIGAAREVIYPLRAFVCDACFLVQIEDVESREFHFHEDYPYQSSFSDTWLAHARSLAGDAVRRFGLTPASQVVEVASNDGYLLRHFVEAGIPALGVDPARNCAEAARAWGVATQVGFFGREMGQTLLRDGFGADLIIGINVLAHVPDLNDFLAGFQTLIKPGGTIVFEFPHLLKLIEDCAFDTIYHEHYSYLSLTALRPLLARHGLVPYDVERLSTHGGSLRLYVGRAEDQPAPTAALASVERLEAESGLENLETYRAFPSKVAALKRDLLSLLIDLKRDGARICGYGAPAKASTLLGYCGIGTDVIDFTVDRNPLKQGRLVPGTGIPIRAPDDLVQARPDYILVLPWNLMDEIVADQAGAGAWGARFIRPVPVPTIVAASPAASEGAGL